MLFLNNLIIRLLSFVPQSFVWIFARPYIAGTKLEHAFEKIQSLNSRNIEATLDFLGEDPATKEECIHAVSIYKKALDGIARMDLKSGISFKLSHMGLKLDEQFCFENIKQLAAHAGQYNRFVRIDMEDVSLKEQTIELYLKLKKQFPETGIAYQAYLRNGIDEISTLVQEKANVRLCKGAYYWECEKHAYKDGKIINDSYVYLMEKLLSGKCFTAIATHDEELAFQALKLIDRHQVPKDLYEFQMLYGVNEELRDILIDMGHPVRVYVPFGEKWYAYCIRRLKENPRMVGYILSSFFKK